MTRRVLLPVAALLVVLAAPAPAPRAQAPRGETVVASSCTLTCHGAEGTAFAQGVHVDVLDCTACHGGDPSALRDAAGSHSADHGFRGTPARESIPGLCAECHSDPLRMGPYGLSTDQLAYYETSVHGRRFAAGDTNVAVCSDCHGAHGILPAAHPEAPTAPRNQPATCGRCHADAQAMAPYGLPTDVVDRFAASVHGQALLVDQSRGAPACADCHGAHGATPPGVEGIIKVCGNCHQSTRDAFRVSAHAGADTSCAACHEERAHEPGFMRSGCAACHGAHDIVGAGTHLVEGDAPGHCDHCHRTDDVARAFIDAIEQGTARLTGVMERTSEAIESAKASGLFLPHESIYLRESKRALVSIGPLSHSLDVRAVEERFEDGIKRQDRTLELIEQQREVDRDRMLLSGGLAVVLFMLAGLVAVKLGNVRRPS